MATNNKRPVYLKLSEIRLPISGYTSFLHRISGSLMVLAIPIFVYLLELSLRSPEGFNAASEIVHGWYFSLLLFGLVWSVIHHLLAGMRYLLIDWHLGVDKPLNQHTAIAVLIASPILALVLTIQML